MAAEPGPNDVAAALGALLAGAGIGGALLSVTVLMVRHAQAGSPGTPSSTAPTGTTALAMGSIGALVLAGGVAFARASTLGTRWQRVAVAAIAAFATVVPALIAIPLDRVFGSLGLVVLTVSCAAVAAGGWRLGR